MLSDFFEECTHLMRITSIDGLGGVSETWKDGERIMIGVAHQNASEQKIGGNNGIVEKYLLFVPDSVTLMRNDRVRRKRDGKIFRVTADSIAMTTPDIAQLRCSVVTAEVVTP